MTLEVRGARETLPDQRASARRYVRKHRGGTSATTAWVKATKFRVAKVSPAAGKAIMLVLADYVDSDGATWLGAKALAELSDLSERVVRRFIAGAIEAQWICTKATAKPSGRGRGLDRLFIHVEGEALFCNCALAQDQHAKLADEKVGTNLPPSADQPATQRGIGEGTPLIPEPAKEPASRLCALLADLIEENGSKRPRVTTAWVDEMDRMLRLDGRDPEKAERAIRWCQSDDFWRGNILSPGKLRKHYDALRLAAKRANGTGRPPQPNPDAVWSEYSNAWVS